VQYAQATYTVHIPVLEAKGSSLEYDPKNNSSDINNDRLINILDLVAVARQFGQSGRNLYGGGTVNISNLVEAHSTLVSKIGLLVLVQRYLVEERRRSSQITPDRLKTNKHAGTGNTIYIPLTEPIVSNRVGAWISC